MKSFIDFAAYRAAVYSPPPALIALAEIDPFWLTLGGSTADPWGDSGRALRERQAAYGHTGPGGTELDRLIDAGPQKRKEQT